MKLRQPWLIKLVAFAGVVFLRLWLGTLRYRFLALGPRIDVKRVDRRQRFLWIFWHEYMLVPAYLYPREDVHVLISTHADGELIAQVCRRLGFQTVRGSTTRRGVEATRQMLKMSQDGQLVVTPDGPRGPRRRLQSGVVHLAALTGLPILPMGFAFDRPWRARSWDRFALPWPGSRAASVSGEPIVVPADATREELEAYRVQVEEALNRVTACAEQLAGGQALDTPAQTVS